MYPLKFQPVFQKRLWGGQRLCGILGKSVPREFEKEPVGESWELADLPPGTVKGDSAGAAADGSLSSVIANGPLAGKTLRQVLSNSEFRIQNSESGANRGYFPLLVKFLDAQQDLSVQVHPDEAYCRRHPGSHLKSEAWYILHAEPGAKIYKGLKPGVTKEQFRAVLEAGTVEPLLNSIKVLRGDCHYLASGTVHALGAGILAAEVQTPSDTTFRVFDWNRLTPDGKPRQLHVEQALECIDFVTPAGVPQVQPAAESPHATRLVSCDYFTLDRVELPQSQQRSMPTDAPRIWIVLAGQAVITCDAPGSASTTALTRGDTVLIPPDTKEAMVKSISDCIWLEATFPSQRC